MMNWNFFKSKYSFKKKSMSMQAGNGSRHQARKRFGERFSASVTGSRLGMAWAPTKNWGSKKRNRS